MINSKGLSVALILVAGLSVSTAQAAGLFELNFGTGGDTIAKGDSGGSIDAGNGYGVAFGPHIPFNKSDSLGLNITAGYREYKKTMNDATGSYKVIWRMVPITAVLQYKTDFDLTIGAGATVHRQPKLVYDRGTYEEIVLDNATGAVVQMGMDNNGSLFGIRYTAIDYKYQGITANGNQLAIYLGAQF